MDYVLEEKYQSLVKRIEKDFDEGMDINTVMMLIGIQELGQGYKKFSKDEKINLMHIATCTVLEPYGFYEFSHNDDDGWPHFKHITPLPALDEKQQEHLIKEAIVNYFNTNKYYSEEE